MDIDRLATDHVEKALADIEVLIRPATGAKILGVARPTVYKMISQGLLPSVQWSADGSRPTVRIRVEDLRNFIENHRQPHDSSSCDTPVKPQLVRIENA